MGIALSSRIASDGHCYSEHRGSCKKGWKKKHFCRFISRSAMQSANYAASRCLSVRLSLSGVVSKRLNISSKFITVPSFYMCPPENM